MSPTVAKETHSEQCSVRVALFVDVHHGIAYSEQSSQARSANRRGAAGSPDLGPNNAIRRPPFQDNDVFEPSDTQGLERLVQFPARQVDLPPGDRRIAVRGWSRGVRPVHQSADLANL